MVHPIDDDDLLEFKYRKELHMHGCMVLEDMGQVVVEVGKDLDYLYGQRYYVSIHHCKQGQKYIRKKREGESNYDFKLSIIVNQ